VCSPPVAAAAADNMLCALPESKLAALGKSNCSANMTVASARTTFTLNCPLFSLSARTWRIAADTRQEDVHVMEALILRSLYRYKKTRIRRLWRKRPKVMHTIFWLIFGVCSSALFNFGLRLAHIIAMKKICLNFMANHKFSSCKTLISAWRKASFALSLTAFSVQWCDNLLV
jgi:hypothetical protein